MAKYHAQNCSTQDSLHGLKVLVPRTHPQGEPISNLIKAHGGTAVLFPVIEITPPNNFTPLDDALTHLHEVDLMILVSVSAVQRLVERQRMLAITMPTKIKVAAVGAKTAARCESLGIKVDFVPTQRIDSEGLLACLGGFRLKGKQVIIFRGQSGRELLKTELQKQGAVVKYVTCYQIRTTSQSIQPIIEKWVCGNINAVLITSVSILESLVDLLGQPNIELLKKTTVITISHRIAHQCTQAGIDDVMVADSPSDQHVLQKLASMLGE